MQVVKNNKDIKFEEETEEPRLVNIADVKDLNLTKNTKSSIGEIDETICQVCVKGVYIMKFFWTVNLLDNCFSMQVVENNKGADFDAEEEEPRLAKTAEDIQLNLPKNRESNANEVEVVKSRHLNMETKFSLSKDVEELKSKINSLGSQLIEVSLLVIDSWYSTI